MLARFATVGLLTRRGSLAPNGRLRSADPLLNVGLLTLLDPFAADGFLVEHGSLSHFGLLEDASALRFFGLLTAPSSLRVAGFLYRDNYQSHPRSLGLTTPVCPNFSSTYSGLTGNPITSLPTSQ